MSSSWPAALALLFLLGSSDASKLSDEQNAALQESCGKDMRVGHYSRKVLNGTAAQAGEAPFAVALYLTDHEGKTAYTTGTLISDRHILTYDYLFLTNTTDGIKFRHNLEALGSQTCEGHDLILPKHLVRRVSAFLEMLKADSFKGKTQLQVRSVTILNGCATPFHLRRVAVVELTKPLLKEQAKPICIPASKSLRTFGFYGFGDNRGDVLDATLRHTKLTIIPCKTFSWTHETFCVKPKEALCNGDFGGAAIRRLDGHVEAFGIYINGPYECSKADEDTEYVFANLTDISGSICKATGVCELSYEGPGTTDGPRDSGATGDQTVGPVVDYTGNPEPSTPSDPSATDGYTDVYPDVYTGAPTGYPRPTGSYTRPQDPFPATNDYPRPSTRQNPATDDYTGGPIELTTPSIAGRPSGSQMGQANCTFQEDDGDIHIHIHLGDDFKKRGSLKKAVTTVRGKRLDVRLG